MLSIYQKDIVEKICKEYCDGVEENGKTIKSVKELKTNDMLGIRFTDGEVKTKVL